MDSITFAILAKLPLKITIQPILGTFQYMMRLISSYLSEFTTTEEKLMWNPSLLIDNPYIVHLGKSSEFEIKGPMIIIAADIK